MFCFANAMLALLNAPCADLVWGLGQGHLSRSVIMLHTQPHHKTELQLFRRETAVPGCNLAGGPHDDISAVINGCLPDHSSHLVGDPRDLYQLRVYSISLLK